MSDANISSELNLKNNEEDSVDNGESMMKNEVESPPELKNLVKSISETEIRIESDIEDEVGIESDVENITLQKSTTETQMEDSESVDITPDKSGGLIKKIIQEGEGNENPGLGDKVSVHYTGWLLTREKPTMFDSNRKGDKMEFNLGRGLVIKGWDLGISTMKKGEIALFIVQPSYAYGEMGLMPTIPPHTPLLFEIELYEWKLEDLSPKKDNGILRKVIERGEDSKPPNDFSQVKVKLVGSIENKVVEDAEKEFIIGEGCTSNVPEGIEIALLKFHLKERSILYMKSKYAFDKGCEERDIPPDTDMQYEVTLLELERAKDIWEMDSDEKFSRAKSCKEKGVSFLQSGFHKAAVKQFKWILVCLEKEPGANSDTEDERKSLLFSGYLNMALCYLKLENYVDAIKVCDKALEIDPRNEKALFRRGQVINI